MKRHVWINVSRDYCLLWLRKLLERLLCAVFSCNIKMPSHDSRMSGKWHRVSVRNWYHRFARTCSDHYMAKCAFAMPMLQRCHECITLSLLACHDNARRSHACVGTVKFRVPCMPSCVHQRRDQRHLGTAAPRINNENIFFAFLFESFVHSSQSTELI